eukprot:GSA120T00025530001.1
MITAVKDIVINRSFSWAQWGINKAVSISVSLLTAGASALKTAAQVAAAGLQGALEFTKEALVLGAKLVAKAGIQAAVKEAFTHVASVMVAEGAGPIVERIINEHLQPDVYRTLTSSPAVSELMEVDGAAGNRFYRQKLTEAVESLLSPQIDPGQQLTTMAGDSIGNRELATGIKTYIENVAKALLPGPLQLAVQLLEISKVAARITEIVRQLGPVLQRAANTMQTEHKKIFNYVKDHYDAMINWFGGRRQDEDQEEYDQRLSNKLQENIETQKRWPKWSAIPLWVREVDGETVQTYVRLQLQKVRSSTGDPPSNQQAPSSSSSSGDTRGSSRGHGANFNATQGYQAQVQTSVVTVRDTAEEISQRASGVMKDLIENGAIMPAVQFGIGQLSKKMWQSWDDKLDNELQIFRSKTHQAMAFSGKPAARALVATVRDAERTAILAKFSPKEQAKVRKMLLQQDLDSAMDAAGA